MPILVGWTTRGNLRVDDTETNTPLAIICFFRDATRLEKLDFLHKLIEEALNTPELTEEQDTGGQVNANDGKH